MPAGTASHAAPFSAIVFRHTSRHSLTFSLSSSTAKPSQLCACPCNHSVIPCHSTASPHDSCGISLNPSALSLKPLALSLNPPALSLNPPSLSRNPPALSQLAYLEDSQVELPRPLLSEYEKRPALALSESSRPTLSNEALLTGRGDHRLRRRQGLTPNSFTAQIQMFCHRNQSSQYLKVAQTQCRVWYR